MLSIEYLSKLSEEYKDAFKVKVEEFTIANKQFNFKIVLHSNGSE